MALRQQKADKSLLRELEEVAEKANALSNFIRDSNTISNAFPSGQLMEICEALGNLPNGTAEGCRIPLEYARERLPSIRRRYIAPADLIDHSNSDDPPPSFRGSPLDHHVSNLLTASTTALDEYRRQSSEELDDRIVPDAEIALEKSDEFHGLETRVKSIEASMRGLGNELDERLNTESEPADNLRRTVRDAESLSKLGRAELSMPRIFPRWLVRLGKTLSNYPRMIEGLGKLIDVTIDVLRPAVKAWNDFWSKVLMDSLVGLQTVGRELQSAGQRLDQHYQDDKAEEQDGKSEPDGDWNSPSASLSDNASENFKEVVPIDDNLREAINHVFEGVVKIGSDGRLQTYNPAFGNMWQIPSSFLENRPHISEIVDRMSDLLEPVDDWQTEKERLIGILTGRETYSDRIERTDGTVLEYATVPLPDGAVQVSYLDVTASINMERALRERNEALETADRLKSEFIANVSYELRTPLNTIIGFNEILAGKYFGDLNDRQTEYSAGIMESSNRLLMLIDDILDLATIEAGHMSLELNSIDLKTLLSSTLGLIREPARQKMINLEEDCPEDIGPIVADERRLKQALFNILSNAVKFTPENGSIRMSAQRNGDTVVLTTSDSGIGISAEDQERVFEKFKRGSNAEARRSGAGLGLSLAKSFVELHGGRVELASVPQEGTTVTCYLPLKPGKQN